MKQSLSKIWIVVILAIFIAGGILAWQYLMAPEEEAKVPEEKAPEEVELNYKNMLGQMFPEKEFSEVKEKYFKDRENRTYYVEEVLEGSFIDLDEKNILLIVRRPRDELVHVEGFYQAFLTVFDIEGKEILTETMALVGDEGKIALYNCKEGTFVFFTGSVTYQGWTEGGVSLYKIKDRKFEEIWPEDEDEEIWVLNRIVEPKEDRLVVYEREKIEPDFVCPTQCLYISIYRPGSAMYSYAFVYSCDLYWNSNTCSFELIDETADWEVYRNEYSYEEDYWGYEIKYPPDWTITEYKGVHQAKWASPRTMISPLREIFIKTYGASRHGGFYIDTINCTWSESKEEWFKKYPELELKTYPRPIGKEKIGQLEFCRLEDIGGDEIRKIGGLGIRYVIFKNGWDYRNTLWVYYDISEDYQLSEDEFHYELDVFKKMLSTFRFIEK